MTHASEIADLVDRIGDLLANNPPANQGAVIADLLAIWLAGHYIPGDADATREWREEVLNDFLALARSLIPINAQVLGTTA